MEITQAQCEAAVDLMEIAENGRRQMELAQIGIARILGVDDENTWVSDAVAGGSDFEKMLAMTNTTVKSEQE